MDNKEEAYKKLGQKVKDVASQHNAPAWLKENLMLLGEHMDYVAPCRVVECEPITFVYLH